MAKVALHQCVVCEYDSEDKDSCQITKIHYSYEFLDDFITPQPSITAFVADVFRWNDKNVHKNMAEAVIQNEMYCEDSPMKSIPTIRDPKNTDGENINSNLVLQCENDQRWMQEKFNLENHPIELMVSY